MRTSEKLLRAKWGLVFVFTAALAGTALAVETWVRAVPAGDEYVVTAVLVPGLEGSEVCGHPRGDDHVDFRIGFGADLQLTVNGAPAGPFDPGATYSVNVRCRKIGAQWFADTRVVNQTTGVLVFEQVGYQMPGAAEEVCATAADVIQLDVQ